MTRKELERCVQALVDGTIEAGEFAEFEAELARSEEARAFYRHSMAVEMGLKVLLDDAHVDPVRHSARVERVVSRQQRRAMLVGVSSAAAVLLLMAITLNHFFFQPKRGGVGLRVTPGTDISPASMVAGGRLAPDEPLLIRSGVVEVEFDQGVRGVIEGPASFTVTKSGNMLLQEGRAWFEVGKGAEGFTVTTPNSIIIDRGTEFGIQTRLGELDVVEVEKGKVEAMCRYALKQTKVVHRGEVFQGTPVGRWSDSGENGSEFLRTLPGKLPGIHFSFDGDNEEALRPVGIREDVRRMRVRTVGGGEMRRVDGVRGQALSVRDYASQIVTDWPGIAGAAPRSVACWIRVMSPPPIYAETRNDGLYYRGIVGWGKEDGGNGKWKLLVARLPGRDHDVFRLSTGNVFFSGTTPLELGEWYHVAAVFRGSRFGEGEEMVELYVNGKREQVDKIFTKPPRRDREIDTLVNGPGASPLVIGRGPYVNKSKELPFGGDIDELSIFPHALSPEAVARLAELSGR